MQREIYLSLLLLSVVSFLSLFDILVTNYCNEEVFPSTIDVLFNKAKAMNGKKNSNDRHELFAKELQLNNIFTKIQQKDPSIWSLNKEIQQSIADRLGWVHSDQFIHQSKTKINEFYEKVQHANYQSFVWIGMGGSSLFAKTLVHVFQTDHFHVLDSTDTEHIDDCLSKVDLSNTLFFVASKSGTTLETISVFNYLQQLNIPDNHFISISDPDTPLSTLFAAKEKNFYDQFINPSDIGGRFSSLSYFGLLPFALINFQAFKTNVSYFLEHFTDNNLQSKLEIFTAHVFDLYKNQNCNKLILHFPNQLSYFTHWVEQLIAESTGKNNCGFIPLPAQYIDADREDFIHVHHSSEHTNSEDNCYHALSFPLNAESDTLLLQSYLWMKITSVLGYFLHINPFDEPNVSLSKSLTQNYLEQDITESRNIDPTPYASLLDHLDTLTDKNKFIAILFFGFNEKESLERLCKKIAKTYHCPCIPYYGPQYLHSVGQYFKGGHNDASFILVYKDSTHVSEQQSHLERIKFAQSLGDYHALKQLKKPAFFIKKDTLFKLFQIHEKQ